MLILNDHTSANYPWKSCTSWNISQGGGVELQMDPLFQDERVLFRGKADGLLVTTHRVREGSGSEFTSIMLEEVCSVRTMRIAWRSLLAGCAVCAAIAGYFAIASLRSDHVAVIQDSQVRASVFAVFGVLCLLAFWVSGFSAVEIASAGARIQCRMSSAKAVAEFVATLESAKNQRYTLAATGRYSAMETVDSN